MNVFILSFRVKPEVECQNSSALQIKSRSKVLKLIVYAVIFFMTIGQSIAGIWQCPEKTSDSDIEYTISFELPEKNTDTITMRHIYTQTNQDAFGALDLKVIRGDENSKIALLTNPYAISTYYFDLKRRLVTRAKIIGGIAHGNLIKTTYKCKTKIFDEPGFD